MQRQHGELVPIGEVIADLPGPVKAIRKTLPPARRGFTLADQVNQLVSASEANPDLGFMARLMALCSLPRTLLAFQQLVSLQIMVASFRKITPATGPPHM